MEEYEQEFGSQAAQLSSAELEEVRKNLSTLETAFSDVIQ